MIANKIIAVAMLLLAVQSSNTNANSVSTDEVQCPQICPALYAPICADNGKVFKEFSNSCELQASNCRLERSLVQAFAETDMAWCTSELVDNLADALDNLDLMTPACLKPCPMIYAPVCVSNGKYRALLSNSCLLDMYNCALAERADTTPLRLLRADKC